MQRTGCDSVDPFDGILMNLIAIISVEFCYSLVSIVISHYRNFSASSAQHFGPLSTLTLPSKKSLYIPLLGNEELKNFLFSSRRGEHSNCGKTHWKARKFLLFSSRMCLFIPRFSPNTLWSWRHRLALSAIMRKLICELLHSVEL